MTSEQPNQYDPHHLDSNGAAGADEDRSLRCMQYLLGELPASELADFEKQLGDSPALNEELRVQSDLICAISAPAPLKVSVSARSNDRSWRLVAVISVLAASFLIAVIGLRWQQNDGVARLEKPADPSNPADLSNPDSQSNTVDQGNSVDQGSTLPAGIDDEEALLIARAWAADHAGLGLAEVELNLPEAEFYLGDETGNDEPGNDESKDDDSVLSWMVVAIADEPDLQLSESGGTTDG